jgi:hypothetical protein
VTAAQDYGIETMDEETQKMSNAPLDNYGWIEIVVVGVVALGLGFWQLWSINREIARDKEKAGEDVSLDRRPD